MRKMVFNFCLQCWASREACEEHMRRHSAPMPLRKIATAAAVVLLVASACGLTACRDQIPVVTEAASKVVPRAEVVPQPLPTDPPLVVWNGSEAIAQCDKIITDAPEVVGSCHLNAPHTMDDLLNELARQQVDRDAQIRQLEKTIEQLEAPSQERSPHPVQPEWLDKI